MKEAGCKAYTQPERTSPKSTVTCGGGELVKWCLLLLYDLKGLVLFFTIGHASFFFFFKSFNAYRILPDRWSRE